jgi:hypothetical protein
MSSTIPPTYYFNGIQYNSDFFKSSTDGVTLDYAENNYLSRTGAPTSIASNTNFTGDLTIAGQVNFNNLSSPPHCSTLPSNDNDLCNRLYVDSQAALTAYQLYFNYSETFTTPAPASITYKKLNPLQVASPYTLPWTISAVGDQFIAGFFNTLVGENIPTSIPAGVWTMLCYANVNAIADQSHVGVFFTLVGYTSTGAETVLFTSSLSALITVVDSSIGTSSISGTVPLTSLVGYTGLGVKLYINSNTSAVRTGNIFFQNADSYSSILTSFAVQQAPDLLNLNNTWTGINHHNNTVIMSGSQNLSLGSAVQTAGTNSGRILQNGVFTVIANNATSGSTSFTSTNALDAQATSVAITSALVTITPPLTVVGTINGLTVTNKGLSGNVVIGTSSGTGITSANGTTIIGGTAATLITTASGNTCVGTSAFNTLTSGTLNTALGIRAGTVLTTGANNTNIGAMTAIGTNVNTTGSNNTTLGFDAKCSVDALTFATAIGSGAVVATPNTIVLGKSDGNVSCPNTLTTTGAINGLTVSNRGGTNNVVIGNNAGAVLTGVGTVIIGGVAGTLVSSGTDNTCVGTAAFGALTTGGGNTALGRSAGSVLTTGSSNTNIGGLSVSNVNTTGSNNTTLGYNSICSVDALTFATAIGAGAVVGTSGTIVLGRIENLPTAADNTSISGSLIFSNPNPIITTTTGAAFLDFRTISSGTGYMNFSPRANLCFQMAVAGNTSVKSIDLQAGLTMTGGSANFNTSTIASGAITTSGNIALTNASSFIQQTVASPGNNLVVGTVTGGGGLYLNGQGITGILLVGTAIQHNLNTTLPTAGIAPTLGQLGHSATNTTALTAYGPIGSAKLITTFTNIAPGTYLLNGTFQFSCTVAGTTSQVGCGFTTNSGLYATAVPYSVSNNVDFSTTTMSAFSPSVFSKSTSCVITLAIATTFYFIATIGGTGTYTAGGQTSITRIA